MTPATKQIRLVRLAHVCYTHADLTAASRFLVDFGFQELTQTVSPSTGQRTIYYRGTTTQQPFVYCAREGPEDAFGGAAFVVESREDLDYAAQTLPGSEGIVDLEAEGVPGGGLSLTFHDPVDRFPFHLVWGQRGREEEGENQGGNGLPVLQYNFVRVLNLIPLLSAIHRCVLSTEAGLTGCSLQRSTDREIALRGSNRVRTHGHRGIAASPTVYILNCNQAQLPSTNSATLACA